MRFIIQPPIMSSFTYRRIIIIAFIYSITIIPTKFLLMLLPGAEVRFAACIPFVAGMVWGPAGAIGSAIGNFVGDFFFGDNLYICFWGAVSNFFLAYLPYKLWYSCKPDATTQLFIHDTRSFLKILGIIFITAFIFSTMLTAILEACGLALTSETFFIFFSNNFDFPILIGLPLLLLLRKSSICFVIPPHKQAPVRNYHITLAITLLSNLAFVATSFTSDSSRLHLSSIFLLLNTLALAYVSFIPANYNPAYFDKNSRIFYSISTKTNTGFLQLAILSVLFISFSIFVVNPALLEEKQQLDLWQQIFNTMLFSMNIIFIAVLLILWQTEKNFVRPLISLSKNARNFVSNDPSTTPTNQEATDEIDLLTDSFNKMSTDIKRYSTDLCSVIAEKENLAAQLKIAADIQQNMLADTDKINSRLRHYEVCAGMYPAKEVGGDLYDCFFLDEDRLVILIADVAGKGIPAALFMMVTKALLKNNAAESPGSILAKTNSTLCEGNETMMFVTVWLGIVHLPTGLLTYSNAGHNYPLLHTQGQEPQWLVHRSGPALGIKKDLSFCDHILTIPHNSHLLLYTDGISEAENNNHEFFGTDRLLHRFQRTQTPEGILFSVLEFSEDAEQNDDITFLWLERK